MAFNNPTIADFKAFFFRDFPYGTDPAVAILDQDIARAFIGANAINAGLFDDQGTYTNSYMLLAAHNLVVNLRASSQGLAGGFSFLEQSKSVGAISQAFAIPQSILDNPEWTVYATTAYGMQYLAAVMPLLAGQVFAVAGSTRP